MTTPTFYYDPDTDGSAFGPSVVWTHYCPRAFRGYPVQHLPVDVASRWDFLHIVERDVWHLAEVNPLTVTPSILCQICGTHGFITNGKWVPA